MAGLVRGHRPPSCQLLTTTQAPTGSNGYPQQLRKRLGGVLNGSVRLSTGWILVKLINLATSDAADSSADRKDPQSLLFVSAFYFFLHYIIKTRGMGNPWSVVAPPSSRANFYPTLEHGFSCSSPLFPR